MSRVTVRALRRAVRTAVLVPSLLVGALVMSAGSASASINPDDVDRPKISAGDRDFGNKDWLGILSGGIVNWDVTWNGAGRSQCPVYTPWISGILYVKNSAWTSTRVEVDYHDSQHYLEHLWDSASFKPVDDKKHEYVISDTDLYGSTTLDHIIIKIDVYQNGSWQTVGTAVEYRPQRCTGEGDPFPG